MYNTLNNIPVGTEYNPNAPWNHEDNPEKEIEVIISVTLSKTVKIKVSDYEIIDSGKDEDDIPFEEIDYSNCDLKAAVENQYILPQDILKEWDVDDYEVIYNE